MKNLAIFFIVTCVMMLTSCNPIYSNNHNNISTTINTSTQNNTIIEKNNPTPSKYTKAKSEPIPQDSFNSVQEMITKAKQYKTISDIYISSGYQEGNCYYKNFEVEELEIIFKDKKILVPVISNEIKFISGSLMPFGYYCFNLSYQNSSFFLFIYTYKLQTDVNFKNTTPKYTINDIEVYYDGDYYWRFNDYCILIRVDDEDVAKKIINKLKIKTVDLST